MIIGFLSISLDIILLNIFNYQIDNIIIFPIFTLLFIINLILFKQDLKKVLLMLFLYTFLNGLVFLPLFITLLSSLLKKDVSLNNNLLIVIVLLIIYDLLFYLFLGLTDIFLLINKIIVTIPVNILYSSIIYYYFSVLNFKKNSINYYEKKKTKYNN